jgi:hypothetical protein
MCPASSRIQQQAAAIALKYKKEGKRPKPGTASANMAKMSVKELEKFAKTKHKGLPKRKKKKIQESWGQQMDLYIEMIYRWLERKGFSESEIESLLNNTDIFNAISNAEKRGINPVEAIQDLDLEDILINGIYNEEHVNEEEKTAVLNSDNIDFYTEKLKNGLKNVTGNYFLFVQGALNSRPYILINFALGGGQSEWTNGIMQNDKGFIQLMINTEASKGASLSLLGRNFEQKRAGIPKPKQISGTIDTITDYVIKYLSEIIPFMAKKFSIKESKSIAEFISEPFYPLLSNI